MLYDFIFFLDDSQVTFPKVRGRLKLENVQRHIPQLTQVYSLSPLDSYDA